MASNIELASTYNSFSNEQKLYFNLINSNAFASVNGGNLSTSNKGSVDSFSAEYNSKNNSNRLIIQSLIAEGGDGDDILSDFPC